jgi:hypothetical protein
LNNGEGATDFYANDIANCMMGWLYADDGLVSSVLVLGPLVWAAPGAVVLDLDLAILLRLAMGGKFNPSIHLVLSLLIPDSCEGWDCSASAPCHSVYSSVSGYCGDCWWGCGGLDCLDSSPCNADYS